MHRYYCEQPLAVETIATIEGAEAHHMLHVMRASSGDRVTLFDGSGEEFVAEIQRTSRRNVIVRVVEGYKIDRELGFELIVASALPKGDRQRFLIEKLVELGVTRFVPLKTERSVVKPMDSVCDRLRKSVIEASKQCGRNRLMEVAAAMPLVDYLSQDNSSDINRLIAHPYQAEQVPINKSQFHEIAIGPEGGFSDAEIDIAMQNRWIPMSLGCRILRIETAALVLATLVSCS